MSLQPIAGVTATAYLPDATGTPGSAAAPGSGFGTALAGALDNVQTLSADANKLAVQAVTGNLDDIHQATLAATRAQVTLELVSTLRNKGVEAFNDIMRMQA
ncbi:flagellar hook-basal body complex protein FliE [Specibacter cremeus]|uniref:flagellar hook-basal body complex protein FliE n=1 Tax=Specibacter cremeus TaxID=1629051 RepID=UPI000F7A4812|nr:flagellar hook-basal body complex protein FliE [Specibacter cremeus]